MQSEFPPRHAELDRSPLYACRLRRRAGLQISSTAMAAAAANSLFLIPRTPRSEATVAVRRTRGNLGKCMVVKAVATPATGSRQRRPQNVEGEFFVDKRCIDCDACRWMAPDTFVRVGEKSAVFKQPSTKEERLKALQALISCPTNSIHTEKPPKEILQVHEMFPLPVEENLLPGVYHCGYHAENSYGATSYLIVHPEGNVLVDSPKYVERLVRKIENLGGVRYMFLTHEDDVGDHKLWAKRFGCERILHSGDVDDSTKDVEMQLHGSGPWSIGHDFELIHTPGHTEGSVCLFYKPLKILFTGDHLADKRDMGLSIFEMYNKSSVRMQLENVHKFLDLDFLWILPGHGRRVQFRDNQDKNSRLLDFLAAKDKEYGLSLVS